MARTKILALGILLLVSAAAGAATNELTAQLKSPQRLRVSVKAEAISNLYETSSRDANAQAELTLNPSYKVSESLKIGLRSTVRQELHFPNDSELTNTKLSLTRVPLTLTHDSSLILGGGVFIPTNEKDRKKNSFNTALTFEPLMLTNFTLMGSNFVALSGLNLRKNIHTYDRNASGSANISYSAGLYGGIEKEILPNLTLTVDGEYKYARTYQNSMRTNFALSQELTYQVDKDLSFSIGHSNDGDALKASGTDYDIQVFDGNTSVVYANVRSSY